MKIINRLIFLIVIAAGLYGFYYIQYGGDSIVRGDNFFLKGDYDKALEEYLAAIEEKKRKNIEPDSKLLIKIAETYGKLEKFQESIPYLKNILKRKKDNVKAQYLLALYLFKGNFKGAENEFRKLLRIEPSNADANFYLGKIALGNKNYTSALDHLKKAKEADKKNIEIYKLISVIFKHKKKIEEGIDNCREGLELDSECSTLYSDLGYFYILDKEFDKGRKECNTAIGYDYKSAEARHYLGLCCYGTKLVDAAEKQFGEALKYRKDFPLPHYMLGIIEFQRKNFKKSLSHFEKAIEYIKEHKKTNKYYYSPELLPEIRKMIKKVSKLVKI